MKAFALAFMVGLFSCATAYSQPCGVPTSISESFDFPGTYGKKVWTTGQLADGRLMILPVIDGHWPAITERYQGGILYRHYTYPTAVKTPVKAPDPVTKPAPAPTTEEYKKAIEALKKEVEQLRNKETPLKKEEGVSPLPPPKEVKGPPADGPTTPFRRPAPSSKKTTDDK